MSLRTFTRLCDQDGCNSEPFISKSRLKCAMCDAQGCQNDLVQCSHDVLLFRKDFCYSAWDSSANGEAILLKGCLFEAEDSVQRQCNPMDVHRDNCLTCQFDGCNRDLQPLRPPKEGTKCMSTTVNAAVDCRSYKTSKKIGCFAREEDLSGRLELGCNSQRSDEDFLQCGNVANDTCQLCMTSMCNNLGQGE